MSNLYVISGPSGVGKDTLMAFVFERIPSLVGSISVTTRKPRPGEKDGREYFFKSKDEVEEMIRHNELIEWNEFAGNIYGTSKQFVEEKLSNGHDILFCIDVNGAANIKKVYPEAKLIFIAPPSIDTLKMRLTSRGTESDEQIESRLAVAKSELDRQNEFDITVINDNIETAVNEIINYINN